MSLPAVFQTLISRTVRARYALDSLLFRSNPRTEELLEGMRDRASGRPMLVVGNGPSLNQTPLDAFVHLDAIGMNKIDLLFPAITWRPTLTVCVNNLVARQHRQAFEASDVPVFLPWKCRWFLNSANNPNIHFFKNLPTETFSTEVLSGVGSLSPTVTYSALQFAYSLGADPVILLGVDHRFDSNPSRSGIEKRTTEDRNHFSPHYFEPGQYWGLPDLQGSEQSYQRAREAFLQDGRQIFDATIDGALEIFPKISIEEALSLSKL